MRKYLLLIILISGFSETFCQYKNPTLMILPSDNWCVQRYFITEYDNQGSKIKVPNYKQAFQEDTEIGQVISKIGSLMIDRGFTLKDAEQEIKNLEQQSIEDAMTTSSTSSSSLAESPLDRLKRRAKSDIIIQISWTLNKDQSGRSVNFILEAFDAYTSKRVAASTGTGNSSPTLPIPVLLQQSVNNNIDLFVSQIKSHFTDCFENGREATIRIKRWQNWKDNLETEFDGKELSEIINNWMHKNTIKGKFNTTDVTENIMTFEQVKIPVYDDQGKSLDSRMFLRELQKYLKSTPFNIDSKLMTRGIGESILVLGEK